MGGNNCLLKQMDNADSVRNSRTSPTNEVMKNSLSGPNREGSRERK